jgi:hypothetical protein
MLVCLRRPRAEIGRGEKVQATSERGIREVDAEPLTKRCGPTVTCPLATEVRSQPVTLVSPVGCCFPMKAIADIGTLTGL